MQAKQNFRTSHNLLYFINLIMGMGTTVIFAVMPMMGRELQLDQLEILLPFSDTPWQPKELAITVFSAMSTFVYTVTAPLWGRFSDRHGRKKAIQLGLVGYAIGSVIFCLAAGIGLRGAITGISLYLLLLATRAIAVLVNSATQPASSAYIIDTSSVAKRAKNMGRIAASNQLGMMLGPLLAYTTVFGFIAPFAIHAGLMLFASIIVWRWLPSIPIPERPDNSTGVNATFRDIRYRQLLLIFFLAFTMLGMCQQTLAFYIQDLFQLTTKDAAKLYSQGMAYAALTTLISQLVLVPKIAGNPFRLVYFGLPLCLLGFITIAMAETPTILFIGNATLGGGIGLVGPGLTISATFRVQPHEQGQLSGMMTSCAAMGFVIGPLVGGFLYGLNIHAPYWFAAALIVPTTLYALTLTRAANAKSKLEI